MISPGLFVYYMLSDYESEPLSYGIYLDERTCGNTAISISSYERKAAFLHKYEKYRLIDQTTSSAASPIFINDEIAGYIALSVTGGLSSEHMTSLVCFASDMIGELAQHEPSRGEIIAKCQQLIDMAHHPILLIDSSGSIVAANSDSRRFIAVAKPDGSPARIADSLERLDDLTCFSPDGDTHEHRSCNIRTKYDTTFNCEIISKESLSFPGGKKLTAVSKRSPHAVPDTLRSLRLTLPLPCRLNTVYSLHRCNTLYSLYRLNAGFSLYRFNTLYSPCLLNTVYSLHRCNTLYSLRRHNTGISLH